MSIPKKTYTLSKCSLSGRIAVQIVVGLFIFQCQLEHENKNFDNKSPLKKFNISELIAGKNWYDWYFKNSGYKPDESVFGAYITLPVEDRLYMGFGTGAPSRGDGALIAQYDGVDLNPIGTIAEEGVHELLWDSTHKILHIAGTDPSWPDDWTSGNHYICRETGRGHEIIKFRDPENGLVNVIHTWGLWLSPDKVLYAAVNSQDGNFVPDKNIVRRVCYRIKRFFDNTYEYGVTRFGQIFRSFNHGETWELVSNLGFFRAYDILGFDNKIYAIYTDEPETAFKFAISDTNMKIWYDVTQESIRHSRLTKFSDKILAIGYDGKSIFAVENDSISQYFLPPGKIIEDNYNVMVQAKSLLFIICKTAANASEILATTDLIQWRPVARINRSLISISYWKNKKILILSGCGNSATIWKIEV